MPLIVESCSKQEIAASVGGSEELLIELRDNLRAWLKLQPHLPQDISETRLEWIILGSKMSLEKAKQKLDMFYTIRRLVPELFANRDPLGPDIAVLNSISNYAVLPKLTPDRCHTFILQPTTDDASQFDPWAMHKYTFMVGDIHMVEFHGVGDIYVFDLGIVNMGHIMKLSPAVLKKSDIAARKAYAARVKGIHYINAPPLVDRLMSIVKTVLPPKIAERVHVHPVGDMESFYKFVPKSILPKDYGGDEPSMKELSGLLHEKVVGWRDWFLEQEKVLVDERLRPGPAIDGDSLFGFSGSFRKLDVD